MLKLIDINWFQRKMTKRSTAIVAAPHAFSTLRNSRTASQDGPQLNSRLPATLIMLHRYVCYGGIECAC